MADTASSFLTAWSSFYVMTGSSAAALTGLMFVVITLVTGRERPAADAHDGIATFSTPTVMHFAAALLVSAVLSAPWPSLVSAGVVAALIGLCGVVYILRVMYRTRRLTMYTADLEDWTWYTIFPAWRTARSPLQPFRCKRCSFSREASCYSSSLAFATRGTPLRTSRSIAANDTVSRQTVALCRAAPADMQDAEIMLADPSFGPLTDEPADLAGKFVALPLGPGNVAGVGVEFIHV